MTKGQEFRVRRKAIGLSQREVGEYAGGLTDKTVGKLEAGQHISDISRQFLWEALKDAEDAAANPPPPPAPPITTDDLQAVLEELRAFRRLYEDDRARDRAVLGDLVGRVQALEPRTGSRP